MISLWLLEVRFIDLGNQELSIKITIYMKNFTRCCICLIALCFSVQSFAQPKQRRNVKSALPTRFAQHKGEPKSKFSLFDQMMENKKLFNVSASYGNTLLKPSPILTTSRNVQLLCTYLENDYGRISSFSPTSPIKLNTLKTLGFDVKFNAGSALIGNKFYGMSVVELAGMKMLDLYIFNTETWEQVNNSTYVYDKELLATETAKDPLTDKVFGQFFNSSMTGLEFGFINYETKTRTTIKATTNRYVALGYAKTNTVYGVATDGNLYKIDPNTGSETLVGPTGVNILTSAGKYYEQSGEIDPVSGTFYWTATDASEQSKLYTVDLSTGKATEVAQLPHSLVGLAIPGAESKDKAPDKVNNVSISFEKANLTGKIKFTAPTTAYDGTTLSATEELTCIIYANDKQIATCKLLPGKEIEKEVTVNGGMNNFKIIPSNSIGKGAKYIENIWVGYDELQAPENITLTKKENSGSAEIVLNWDATNKPLHNGYVGEITYNIYRIKNGETTLVSAKQSGITYKETLVPTEFSNYYYIVEPVNGYVKGEEIESENFFFGKPYEPTYTETFDTQNSSYPYIKINRVQGSYNDWEWDSDGKYMKCSASLKPKSDNWLISPPIHLKAGYTYFIKYDVLTPAAYTEKLEVKLGKDVIEDETKLNKELLPVTTFAGKTNETHKYEHEIAVTEDGNYSIGFHYVSEKNSYFLGVDNFKVELSASPLSPATVTDLVAETEPSGLEQAIITFKAPTKNNKGDKLTALTKIEVKSDDRLVETVKPAIPGKKYIVTDKNAKYGENTYTIIAYNEKGVGKRATVTVKVGQDKPTGVNNLQTIDQLNSLKLSWDAPKPANGGVLNPAGVWCNIYRIKSASEIEEIGKSEKGATEYVINDFKTYQGAQYISYWGVVPKNATGSGDMKIKSILVGKPYQMPYHRSFANATDENMFMAGIPSPEKDEWIMLKGESSDNDNGCLFFDPKKKGTAMIMLGKISLRGAVKPKLIFDYKCEAGAKRKLLIIAHPMNGKPTVLVKKDFATETTKSNQWQREVVEVPTELTKVNYINFTIIGDATEEQADKPIYIDNIHFIDPLPTDGEIKLNASPFAKKGHKITVNAKVTNLGDNNIDSKATIKLYANGNEVASTQLTKVLKTTDFETVALSFQTSLKDNKQKIDLRAEVSIPNDVDKKNNISSSVITFVKHDVPQPQNLKITNTNSSSVAMTWQAPNIETPTITEDFESYSPWSTSMGEWTLVDRDKGYAVSLDPENFSFPNNRKQFAFLVAKPNDYPNSKYYKHIKSHSGEKAAMSFIQVANLSKAIPMQADNWIISPILPGKAQTINFWVKNIAKFGETFEILYSKGISANNINEFLKLGKPQTIATGQWTNITVDIPEGTRFFAIRQITSARTVTMFMIDDITYTKGNTPIAYNIYRDGILVGSSSTTSFKEVNSISDGKHTYSLSAVYADGKESEPIDVDVVTAINNINNNKSCFDVYTLDGVLLLRNANSINSLKQGVYIINGKKVVITNNK